MRAHATTITHRRRFAFALSAAAACALFLLPSLPTGRGTVVARQNPAAGSTSAPVQSPAMVGVDSSGLLKLNVTVTDKYGQYVTGLTREAFSISEGKTPAEVRYFSAEESPQSVVVVFDVSGSIGWRSLDAAGGALVRFMQQAHASNEYFIIGFNNRTHLLTDWTRDGKVINEALSKLRQLKPDGTGTALYDALALGVEHTARGSRPKRVILLISDGMDNKSDVRRGKVREQIKRSDVLVYAVGIGDYEFPFGSTGRFVLEELTRPSGGGVFSANTEGGTDEAFRRVALELHSQYVVGYKPTAADGKWHKVKVKVHPPEGLPGLKVRAREEHYAAPAPQSPASTSP